MKVTFKTIIYSFSVFALLLLIFRMFKVENPNYIFLAWNLFLAFIPYWVSNFVTKQDKFKFLHIPLLCIWLLFLPNSPYILTDLFHLRQWHGMPLWFDLVMVCSFALIGFILLYKSIIDVVQFFKKHFPGNYLNFSLPLLFLLVAFGLYLGRYLRFNSWDAMNHPFRLVRASYHTAFHKDTIGFTVIFAAFMWLVYLTLINFNSKEKSQ